MKRKLTYVVPFVLPLMLLGCDQNKPVNDPDPVQQEAPNSDVTTQDSVTQSPSDSDVAHPTDSAVPNNADPVSPTTPTDTTPNGVMDTESANPEVGNQDSVNHMDSHNARNSLDVDGVYQGQMTVGGVDTNVVLTLDDKDRYTYQSGSQQKSGEYRWRDQGDAITLYDGQNPFLTLKVNEGSLVVTDQQANSIKDSKGQEITFTKQLDSQQ